METEGNTQRVYNDIEHSRNKRASHIHNHSVQIRNSKMSTHSFATNTSPIPLVLKVVNSVNIAVKIKILGRFRSTDGGPWSS